MVIYGSVPTKVFKIRDVIFITYFKRTSIIINL